MSEKKLSSKTLMVIVSVVFIVLIGAMLVASPPLPVEQQPAAADQPTTGDQVLTPPPPGDQAAQTPAADSSASVFLIDVNAALSDRILGDASAPLKIAEHASLTCSHCAEFHKNTFDEVKKNFIDTGKAYLLFSDFPLNAPALHASMVARCLPQDKYFDFLHTLFTRQEEWAFDSNYLAWLKTESGNSGLSPEKFDACVANKELEEGLKNRMQSVQDQWKIASTPSFVINNSVTLAGAYPYVDFEKALNSELAKISGTAPAVETPAEEPAPETSEAVESTPVTETPPPQE